MSAEVQIKFRSVEDAERVDLTRIGIISGASEDGLTVTVEPDIDGWDGLRDEVGPEIIRSAFMALGVTVDIFNSKGHALSTSGGTGW